MGKPKAPPPPNYEAQAVAQGESSKDAALFNTNLNRANQVGPTGSSTWSLREGADPNNPQAGDWTQTTTLAPGEQALYDAGNNISNQFMGIAGNQLGRASDAMSQPFSTTGMPALTTGGSYNPVNNYAPKPGELQTGVQGGKIQTSLGVNDYAKQRDQVTDALMTRQNPGLQQQEEATRSRLMAAGVEPGSEGWQREMQNSAFARNDAQMAAILAGGQEQSRMNNDALQGGNFVNQAQAQGFGQGMANLQANNTAQGQKYQQGLTSAQFANDAAYRNFQADIQGAQMGNQTRQQGIAEQAYLRSLPLNEVNALRSGSQVQMPQFGNYYTGGQAQAAPLLDASIAQGNYNAQMAAGNQSGNNAMLGGLANLGSAWIMSSDERLKHDFFEVGTHRTGVPLYTYKWADGSPGFGVKAQELRAVRPDAVHEIDGVLKVDYGAIGGLS